MAVEEMEIEGTWDEILQRSAEFAGRRVRLRVLKEEMSPEERQAKALAWLKRRNENPLTQEEICILDEMEEFQKTHRFRLRHPDRLDET